MGQRGAVFWPRPCPLPAVALPQGCGHAQRRRLFRFPSGPGRRHCRRLPALPCRRPRGSAAARPSGSRGCAPARLVFPPRFPFRPRLPRAARLPGAAPEPAGSSDRGASLGRGPFLAWGKCADRPGRGPSLSSSFLLGGLAGASGPQQPTCRGQRRGSRHLRSGSRGSWGGGSLSAP